MVEIKVKHVLLFLVGVFLVYHMIGRCGVCMNNLYSDTTCTLEGLDNDDIWTKQLGQNERRILIIRHAEKPPAGLGTLSCKGLNRSLLLIDVLNKYPQANYVMAPNPAVQHYENHGDRKKHNYIRPLLTIAPYSISLGLPVDTTIGAGSDTQDVLVTKLYNDEYAGKDITIAWEHSDITGITNILFERMFSNKRRQVDEWENTDFDSIYRFYINTIDPSQNEFKIEKQNIDGDTRLKNVCPIIPNPQLPNP
jgi:hypothetical protein